MNSRCPACGHDHCEDIIGLADRLAALEARLPVVAKCEPWCGSSTSPGTGREFQCDINRQSRYFCTDACRFMERPLAPAASEPTPPPGAEPPCFMSDRRMRYLPGWVAPLDHEGKSRVVLERGPIRAAGGGMAFYCRTPSGALVSVHVEEDGIGATHEGPDGKKFGGIDWECVAVYGTTPPPGNLGIPEGFKLGDGWGVAAPYWKCHAHRMIHAANATRTMAPSKGYSVCWDEATRNGALVPVEPPAKAEAAQAAEPSAPAGTHEACEQCQAPSGMPCLNLAGQERRSHVGRKAAAARSVSKHDFYPCEKPGCRGAACVPIAEPAAPPVTINLSDLPPLEYPGCVGDGDRLSLHVDAPRVAAKLSERDALADATPELIEDTVKIARVIKRTGFSMGLDQERCRVIVALETALDAARRDRAEAMRDNYGMEGELQTLRSQLATRNARITGLERSAAEDSKARAALEARCAAAEHDAGVLTRRIANLSCEPE